VRRVQAAAGGWHQNCGKASVMTKQLVLVLPLLGLLLLTSCATPGQQEAEGKRFQDEQSADIVIRYYSEGVNRVLKPLQMEGPFLSTFDKGGVIDLATHQTGRELAVVILLRFNSTDQVKQDWQRNLMGVGYKRVVFLRAEGGLKINGLPILDNPREITVGPAKVPEPNV
jgi:hypothetical protein